MALTAQIDTNTVMVGDLNTPLSPIDRSPRQKINKGTSEILHTLDQTDMIDIYRVFHTTSRQYTFFFCSSRNFLQNRSYFRTQNKTQQIQENWNNPCIISDHNGIRLHLNNKRNHRKIFKHMETEQHTGENQWVTEVKREKSKKFLESNENEIQPTRICRTQQRPC
jgi:hypothetical protein